MKLRNLTFLVCLLFVGAFYSGAMAQTPTVLELEGVTALDIRQDEAAPVDFGEIDPGTMVRKKMSFENTYDETIVLVRIISGPGCFTAGTTNTLRDVKVEPGEKVDFYLMTTAQKPGNYDIKNEVIIEKGDRRYRRAVFQFKGFVNGVEDQG